MKKVSVSKAYIGETHELHCDLAYWKAYIRAYISIGIQMAKKSIVTVKGDKELHAAFKRLKGVARGQALLTAAKAGILPIQNEAIILVAYKSGTLRRSIHTEVLEEKNTSVLVATGTDVTYARRIEFGFNDTDSLGRSYHQSAQPYMRPAYDNKRSEAIAEVGDVLRSIVNSFI